MVAFPVKSKKKPSRRVNVFASDMFTVKSPGPFRMFLPMLPNVPGVGAAKALERALEDLKGTPFAAHARERLSRRRPT